MTFFKSIMLISALVISASTFAHSDGHGQINADKVISIAQTSAKMLTFKDHGMSVGKIDKSWNDLTKDQFRIVEEGKSNFIVKAMNTKTKKVLYFDISKKGEIKDVKSGGSFRDGHGHSH